MSQAGSQSRRWTERFEPWSRWAVPAGSLAALLLVALVVKGCGGVAARSGDDGHAREPQSGQGGGDHQSGRKGRLPAALAISQKMARDMAGMQLHTAEPRNLSSEIVCNGSIGFNLNRYAQVRPRVDGILRHIIVDVGAAVHGGDELAIVDSATLGEYKSSYVYAVVNEKYTADYCGRLRKLADQQAIPSKTLFEMEHMLQEQQLDVARARQKLVNLGFSNEQIDKFVADNDTHAELAITAPWDGVIVERHAVEGEAVSGNVAVFAVTDLGTMWVQLSVYESDLSRIALGQELTFIADGLPDQKFPAKVTWISPEVDAQTRTIQVRAEAANADRALRANMFGKGRLVVQSARDALVVPIEAVQSVGKEHVVFVPKDGEHFEVRKVELGIQGNDFWQIKSGLSQGEQVVTRGSFLLKSNLENDAFSKVE